ncbi:uncharacterized protein LOC144727483 isoform X1 [Lampetra planeri]
MFNEFLNVSSINEQSPLVVPHYATILFTVGFETVFGYLQSNEKQALRLLPIDKMIIIQLLFTITFMLTLFGLAASEFNCQRKENWSICVPKSVTGLKTKEATLCCNFTYPSSARNFAKKIQVIWKQTNVFERNASYYIFNRTTNTTRADFSGRVSLVGDPEHSSTASIQIRDLKYSDSDDYYCRFEIEDQYETQHAIHLEVHSIPQVWNLTKVDVTDPVNSSIFWCTVEGKPKPNITWDVPPEVARPLDAEVADDAGSGPNRYSSRLIICGELPPGGYTCRAINQHGEDSTSHDVEPAPTNASAIFIGASAAIVFLCALSALITFWRWRIQRKSNGEVNQELTKEHIYENTSADKSGAGQCESSSPNVDDGDVTYAAVIVGADARREAPTSQDHDVVYASIVA